MSSLPPSDFVLRLGSAEDDAEEIDRVTRDLLQELRDQPVESVALVLEPGTSAGAAYFVPVAKWITSTLPGWQVWAVQRRENLLDRRSQAYFPIGGTARRLICQLP